MSVASRRGRRSTRSSSSKWRRGKPRNPLTNAGAIVVCDQLIGATRRRRCGRRAGRLSPRAAATTRIAIDEGLAMSESQAGALNRSLAISSPPSAICQSGRGGALSLLPDMLGGDELPPARARGPVPGVRRGRSADRRREVTIPSRSRRINALMLTCGHYDNSGDFAFRVGLPGKSAMSGGILAIVPGHRRRLRLVARAQCGGHVAGGSDRARAAGGATGWSVFV
jgi:glutaminase